MRKRQILWAVVFGAALAITGCGDDSGNGGDGGSSGSGGTAGTGGSAGSGGGSGSDFCSTLCNACAAEQAAACTSECESQLVGLPSQVDLDSCPTELDAVGECLGANDCNSDNCQSQFTAWFTCIVGVPF